MPRPPRLFLPQQPQHIVVRGHNRNTVLYCDDDFQFLYKCLRKAAHKNGLAIHAWVFMNNHIHLLVTPENEASLPKTMQSTGRLYAQYYNRSYQRTGSLWEGRYKSSLVDSDNYLLSCYRYIELNPVRAGIVSKPENYPYSSFHANALGKADAMVTPHELFLSYISVVKTTKELRGYNRKRYLDLCSELLGRKTLTDIRRGTAKGRGIGGADFQHKIAQLK